MNVIDMLLKPDKRFAFQRNAGDGTGWQTIPFPKELLRKFPASASQLNSPLVRGCAVPIRSRIYVRDAALYWPNFVRGLGTFQIRGTTEAPAQLQVWWQKGDARGPVTVATSASTRMLRFDVPPAHEDYPDLVIAAGEDNTAEVFLGVHQMLNRAELLSRMSGEGVEIGPGPKPQALPDRNRRVRYVEQATPAMWQSLYGKETPTPVNKDLWDHYVVGTADNIPAKKESLDFIFSSHVVEHLANPLGHFAYWSSLLKSDGFVAAVIPDRDGCQDYAFPASTVEEIVAEWRGGSMQVTPEHFRRWGSVQMPKSSVEDLMKSGRSIHVHFYTPASMAELLARTATQIGFQRFAITNQPNHKDFFVVLEKGRPGATPPYLLRTLHGFISNRNR